MRGVHLNQCQQCILLFPAILILEFNRKVWGSQSVAEPLDRRNIPPTQKIIMGFWPLDSETRVLKTLAFQGLLQALADSMSVRFQQAGVDKMPYYHSYTGTACVSECVLIML